MNSEPHLEFIAGTMFSGKTTELIRRTNLYEVAGIKSQIFKHTIDDRYS
ncbi:MAG: thymidine kinase, partial [Nanoarchaeota archaeon]|nr:thymidine kinase [Nanoarchaeota archaeon]